MSDHTSEHTPQKAPYDDLSVGSIALVGGVGSVLVFVAVIAVQVVYFRYERAEHQRKVLDVPTVKVDAVLETQREKLATAGSGANAERGERSIPIDEAMAIVLAEYEAKRANDSEPSESGESSGDTAGEEASADQEEATGKVEGQDESADAVAAEKK